VIFATDIILFINHKTAILETPDEFQRKQMANYNICSWQVRVRSYIFVWILI